jgi:hypothetical protein
MQNKNNTEMRDMITRKELAILFLLGKEYMEICVRNGATIEEAKKEVASPMAMNAIAERARELYQLEYVN